MHKIYKKKNFKIDIFIEYESAKYTLLFLALGREEEEYMYIGTKCLRYNFYFCIVESAARIQRTPVILCVYPRVARPSNRGSDETGVQQVVWIIAKRACVTEKFKYLTNVHAIWVVFLYVLGFFFRFKRKSVVLPPYEHEYRHGFQHMCPM